jgi:multiple sugar transport system permease protein
MNNKKFKNSLDLIIILFVALIWALPIIWILSLSFQPNDILQKTTGNTAFGFIPYPFTAENYIFLWKANFVTWFFNSFIVAISMTVLTVILSSFAGYAFARIPFYGRNIIYFIVLAGLIVPGEILFIPMFTQFSTLGLNNSYIGLILPRLAVPFAVFVMTQYYKGVPKDIEEASIIDGANRFQIFIKIMLPMSIPAMATVAIVTFGFAWNDYLWPIISVSTQEMRTLQVGIALQIGARIQEYMGTSLAGVIVSSIPTILLLIYFQKYLLRGFAIGTK